MCFSISSNFEGVKYSPRQISFIRLLQFDFILNVLFMSYFFMRFIAANDKLVFMFQLYTMIDFFTIPPSFVSLILGRVWIGLRCLRIMRLNSFPEILQYLNILTTARSIRYALCNVVIALKHKFAGFSNLWPCLCPSGGLLQGLSTLLRIMETLHTLTTCRAFPTLSVFTA